MATHAGVALELGIVRPQEGKTSRICMSPQMEAILIWCQCRTREYEVKTKYDAKINKHFFISYNL